MTICSPTSVHADIYACDWACSMHALDRQRDWEGFIELVRELKNRHWLICIFLTSGADRLPWPGRGSIITSVKLLARSSVELLEDIASAPPYPKSVLARTFESDFRMLFVGALGSFKDKGTVWDDSEGFLSIPGMSSTLVLSLKIWKLPESWDRLFQLFFEMGGLESETGSKVTRSESGLGGSVDGLVNGDFRVGFWWLAVITGLHRDRGDCSEADGLGGEKEQVVGILEGDQERRQDVDTEVVGGWSSDRVLASTLSSDMAGLGSGLGITAAWKDRRMESYW